MAADDGAAPSRAGGPFPRVIHSTLLDYNADCAEFCPVPGLTQLLALGTYQLLEEEQRRVGRCYLYALPQPGHAALQPGLSPFSDAATSEAVGHATAAAAHGAAGGGCLPVAGPAATLDMPGIFDIKWAPAAALAIDRIGSWTPNGLGEAESEATGGARALLGAALADGTLRLLEASLGADGAAPGFREVARVEACAGGSMALSLDWQLLTRTQGRLALLGSGGAATEAAEAAEPEVEGGGGSDRVVVSSSGGTVSIVQVRPDGLERLCEWEAHELEVWCAAWHRAQPHVVFSGADDCYFKAWDTRAAPETGAAAAVFSNRRTHSAGVCTISPHPAELHLVATGSYDEHVRLWDVRSLSKPLVQAETTTGGGNWRLRWHPRDRHVLLAACMYNGFAVLRSDAGHTDLQVVSTYQSPNKNIGYGADWWQQEQQVQGAGQQGQDEQEQQGCLRRQQETARAEGAGDPASGRAAEGAADAGGDGSGEASADGGCWLAATCSFYDRPTRLDVAAVKKFLPTLDWQGRADKKGKHNPRYYAGLGVGKGGPFEPVREVFKAALGKCTIVMYVIWTAPGGQHFAHGDGSRRQRAGYKARYVLKVGGTDTGTIYLRMKGEPWECKKAISAGMKGKKA
ncbi:hypothetical protein HYH02_006087 [Chlamydomonas schloesseri]|uniref:methylated diphthine methylhydrolase n=1 Tax=Chlamydomonas schloesseri TaxID=2026947 RepID=A0A836B650_9CHLO|nr:hypothetical protein HYH02_006087 [Chlamydomonas schloesseri]|eukprot:KAG2448732.1 hypothetical protein HYH02_006087 [Chlamydomonas schloesseri]